MTATDDTRRERAFTMTRRVQAPRDLVWQAWSEAGHLARWWGPKGCRVDVESLEFRPGGLFHYRMAFPDAAPSWGRFFYRDIVASERIVWFNAFANAEGGIVRAPFDERVPLEIENSVTLSEEADGTTLSLRACPFGASPAERTFFEELFPSLEQGYGGTFDQLAEHLALGRGRGSASGSDPRV